MLIENFVQSFSRISVIGLGYIGLPTAAILASRKIQVIGVDINMDTINAINRGQVHIVEPELDIIVNAVVTQGYLRASNTPEPADAFLITVPTPFREDYHADLSYVETACLSLAPVLMPGNLIILESTSPVGTTELIAKWLANIRPDLSFPQTAGENADIRIAHCPERVMPGHILKELVQNDRIIGGMTTKCTKRAVELYTLFVEGSCIETNARTAELCKLAENSFRDVNIAFANELSIICDKLNIDVWELIHLANHHPRVTILKPGPGVGGHCISVDPWFIVSQTPEEARLIRTAREVNDAKPLWVIQKVNEKIAECLQENPHKTARDVTILCFGLTFKANIEDLRESPALTIAEKIADNHPGPLYVAEPYITELPTSLKNKAELKEAESALEEADVVLILVEHKQFSFIFNKITPRTKIIDTRGVLSPYRETHGN